MRNDKLAALSLAWFGLALTALADTPSAERNRLPHPRGCLNGDPPKAAPRREWTDDEAREFWDAHAPESAKKSYRKPIRTPRYIVLTNSSCGEKFGERMERNYRTIRSLYPFNEPPGARPLPILLFRTDAEFRSFLVDSLGYAPEEAKDVKGIAKGEFYATWYESPVDPVHLHEATHQLVTNRLGLTGGGSWFHEGLAEYASSSKNDRNVVASRIRDGKAPSLLDLIATPDLAATRGRERGVTGSRISIARERTLHAALFIEFLKESESTKAKFARFLRTVGACPQNDLEAIDAALLDVFGEGVSALDRRFVKWCERR
jgi:hypothetical protein